MRLVSLELHGFKSFADPQKLTFPVGMTAVVGPNGCGKSNISDSLAWVLGEQRASLLRGAEMSDVIFAGAGQRRPMGMAEVKLTLEMPDPALPGASKEVVLTRRLYRDTGSEYRVNGREARLKDVQDLLLDTGLGTRGYTFIQQGQIDLILSSKPKDRRSLLEEAAGITRYKLRRQEAERRLDETKANLQRLEDILHELNKQMDSLRRQAAKARRAAELDAEMRATQRVLLAGKAEELDHAKQGLLDLLDQMERRVSELTAQASEKASEVEHLRLHLDELEQAQGRRSRQVLGLEQRLTLAEQERGFQEERRREAQEQKARAVERADELARRLEEGGQALSNLEAELALAASALAAKEALLAQSEEAVAIALGALRHEEGGLNELRRRKAEAIQAAQQRQKQRLSFQSQIAQLEGRLDALNHEESVRAPRLEGLQVESTKLKGTLEGQEFQVEQGDEAAAAQRRRVHALEEASRSLTQELHRTQSELEAAERQVRQLSDLVAQAAGSLEIRKGLAWLGDRGKKPPLLSDLIRVDEEVRPAFERVLGSWMQSAACGMTDLAASKGAPGQLLLAPDTDAHSPAAPFHCEPLRLGVRWTGTVTPLRALIDRTFRCSDEEFPALAAKHPELAFVSPAFVKLPYGPVQVGEAAPAASPLKLRVELEEAGVRRESLITALEELEERHKRETLGAREAMTACARSKRTCASPAFAATRAGPSSPPAKPSSERSAPLRSGRTRSGNRSRPRSSASKACSGSWKSTRRKRRMWNWSRPMARPRSACAGSNRSWMGIVKPGSRPRGSETAPGPRRTPCSASSRCTSAGVSILTPSASVLAWRRTSRERKALWPRRDWRSWKRRARSSWRSAGRCRPRCKKPSR